MLDELSPVPLYHQLRHIVRERIESGQWPAGQAIPTEAELCEEFDVSRATVTRAMQALVRDGLVRRRRGRGSYAARPKIHHDLLTFSSFSSYVRQQVGRELQDRLLSVGVVPATPALSELLEIGEAAPVVEVRKVKLAEGHPLFLANLYVPSSLCPGLEHQDLSSGSLIELLQERYYHRITRVNGSFEAVLVGEEEASLLGVERGCPAILYHRVRFVGDGRPLMASDHLVRSDTCQLSFDISAPSYR